MATWDEISTTSDMTGQLPWRILVIAISAVQSYTKPPIPNDRVLRDLPMSGVRDYDSAISFLEIVDYCAGEIANFKVTRYVEVVEELSMTQSDKIQKFRLRKMLKKAIEAGTLVRLKLSKKSP